MGRELSAAGGVRCGIIGFLYGSASLGFKGRAVVQPGDGAIFAGPYRFRHDEPEHGVLLARSVFGKLKHAQDKSCGLAAVIQSRIERRQRAVDWDGVSRETIVNSGG